MDEELPHVNPCPPAWLTEEQKAILRGDNVEGTAYNQRWLLNTLVTILKALHELLPTLQGEACDTSLTPFELTPQKCSAVDNAANALDETPSWTPYLNGVDAAATPAPVSTTADAPADQSSSTADGTKENSLQSMENSEYDVLHQPTDVESSATEIQVVEVPRDVEDVACQLWDMCADNHVALHVLELNDRLVLHMLRYTLRDPIAPRLTEILCGIVCNLCYPQEGCEAVLSDASLLLLLVTLPERCTDTLVLVQVFRLLHRLVFHCRHASADRAGTEEERLADAETVTEVPMEADQQEQCADDAERVDKCPLTGTQQHCRSLALALHSSNLENFLEFILKNSFSEVLIDQSVQLLEELLFFQDPHTGRLMADHYAHTGLVSGLLRLVNTWYQKNEQQQRRRRDSAATAAEDDNEDEFVAPHERLDVGERVSASDGVHSLVVCLNAFVDTRAADDIVSSEGEHACLEAALVRYITELSGSVEDELRQHKDELHRGRALHKDPLHTAVLRQCAERLGCALRLLQLLVRSLGLPEVMMSLARLLALLDHSDVFWEGEATDSGLEGSGGERTGRAQEVSDACLSEHFARNAGVVSGDVCKPEQASVKSEIVKNKSIKNVVNSRESRQSSRGGNRSINFLKYLDTLASDVDSSESKEKEKQLKNRQQQSMEFEQHMDVQSDGRVRRRSTLLASSYHDIAQVQDAQEISCLSSSTLAELRDLRAALERYFGHILHYWYTFGELTGVLGDVLRVLEHCHVHEVLLVLAAVKKSDPALVPRLQELLLDHQAFPRLVALLAQLYQ